MSPTDVAGRNQSTVAFIAIASLYIFSIARITVEFADESYNWDVDTYIYYGQELLRGNPLWTDEWTGTPLVFQDFLFAIPSAFGPLLAWRLVSLGSAVLAVICVVLMLPGFLQSTGYPEGEARRAAILSGGLYLLVSGHLPGGFTHINVLPTSMAIMALLLGFSLVGERRNPWKVLASVMLAGLAAAISISIRPYFIFPLAMAFIVLGFLIFAEKQLSIGQKAGRVLGLLLAPAVIGVGLNLGPYIYFGKGWEFFSQLTFFLQTPPTGSNSMMDVFVSADYGIHPGIRLWLVGMLLFAAIELGIVIRRRSPGLVSALIPLSAVMTAVGIMSSHFWDHYSNFFSWYFSIVLASRLIFFEHVISARMRGPLAPFSAPSVIVPIALSSLAALVLLFGVGPTATAPSIAKVDRDHPDLALAQAVESRFSALHVARPPFLVPQNPYVHWKLEESRHGFPNAPQTNKILGGSWENLPPGSYTFRTPRNADDYCAEILESSIDVVVLERSYPLQPCLAEAEPRWSYEPVFVSGGETWGMWWRN